MQNIQIELIISMTDGGKSVSDIIELYGARVVEDIDQTAWNLCDCNDQVQEQKFSNLKLDEWLVTQIQGDNFNIRALTSVFAESSNFAQNVIEEYMDGFADCILQTANSLYSRTGLRIGFNPIPVEWDLDIK
jgi:hypothetical protein